MTQPTVKITQLGLDVGDSYTHFCALGEERQVLERGRFRTTPEALRQILGARPATRVVLEAGSQSPWMSAALRELGHQVLVADPRRVELISQGHRKTDRRDAEVLARLASGMPELLGEVHHRSSQEQAGAAAQPRSPGAHAHQVRAARARLMHGLRIATAVLLGGELPPRGRRGAAGGTAPLSGSDPDDAQGAPGPDPGA